MEDSGTRASQVGLRGSSEPGAPASPSGPKPNPWSRLPPWGRALAKALLTVAATWLVFRGVGLHLSDAWQSIDWGLVRFSVPLLALSFAVLAAAFLLMGWLWARIARWAGGPRISPANAMALILVSSLGRYVPGKIVQVATLATLAARAGVPTVSAGVAAVGSQLLHVSSAALVGALGLAWGSASASWAVGLGVGGAAALYVLIRTRAVDAVLTWGLRRKGHRAWRTQASATAVPLLLLGYGASWFAIGLSFWFLSLGTGLDVPFRVALPAFAAAYAAGYAVFFVPAGIGVREGALAAVLVPVLGEEGGMTLTAAQRVWLTVAEVGGAGWGAAWLRKSRPRTPASP